MTPEAITTLVAAVKRSIRNFGHAWAVLCDKEEVPNVNWALPLLPEGPLFGMDIKPFAVVGTELTYAKFHDSYEQLIESIQTEQRLTWATSGYISDLLGLTWFQDVGVFPAQDFSDRYYCLPALAAIAYHNFDGKILSVNFTTLVVECSGQLYGVRNHEAISNVKRAEPLKKFDVPNKSPHIIKSRRRQFRATELERRFASIYHNLTELSMEPAELDQIKTAFALLLANESEYVNSHWSLGSLNRNRYPNEALAAVEAAKDFDMFKDSFKFLRSLLVPSAITAPEFDSIFGVSYKVTPKMTEYFKEELEALTTKIKNEREALC